MGKSAKRVLHRGRLLTACSPFQLPSFQVLLDTSGATDVPGERARLTLLRARGESWQRVVSESPAWPVVRWASPRWTRAEVQVGEGVSDSGEFTRVETMLWWKQEETALGRSVAPTQPLRGAQQRRPSQISEAILKRSRTGIVARARVQWLMRQVTRGKWFELPVLTLSTTASSSSQRSNHLRSLVSRFTHTSRMLCTFSEYTKLQHRAILLVLG